MPSSGSSSHLLPEGEGLALPLPLGEGPRVRARKCTSSLYRISPPPPYHLDSRFRGNDNNTCHCEPQAKQSRHIFPVIANPAGVKQSPYLAGLLPCFRRDRFIPRNDDAYHSPFAIRSAMLVGPTAFFSAVKATSTISSVGSAVEIFCNASPGQTRNSAQRYLQDRLAEIFNTS